MSSHSDQPQSATQRISISEAVSVAFSSLGANKLRTMLTMLGIIIGVAAVISMVALGMGAQEAVENRISSLGANLLFLRPGAGRSGHVRMAAGSTENIDAKDVAAILRDCPSILAAVPEASRSFQVEFENRNWNTRVTGTTPDYEWVRNRPVSRGSYFTASDDIRRARVCVLGPTVVENLFGDLDPVGRSVKIRNLNFEVVGVLEEKGAEGWYNRDDVILIPVQTALYRVLGRDRYNSVSLRVASEKLIDQASLEIEEVMRRQHKLSEGQDNDFTVRSMSDVASTLGEASQTFTMLLASIALVSLLVGGIGIMNIMLVSVTERTREIGIRMAMGARRRDILVQFLIESIALAFIGGLMGVAVGVGMAVGLSSLYQWNTLVSPLAVVVSFTFSLAVGIFFGILPARKASLLDPIDALRYE